MTENNIQNNEESIFNLFSKYYGLIFGIATIFIICSHLQIIAYLAPIPIEGILVAKFGSLTNIIGECGVKIFFFMAGFGAYYSLNRNPDEWQFLIRKAKRMFPYYYPLVILLLFIYNPNFEIIIGNLFLTGYILAFGDQFFWFHQAIYAIYIISPLLFNILAKSEQCKRRLFIIWFVFLGAGLVWPAEQKNQMIHIIPLFATGMFFCKLHFQNKSAIKYLVPVTYILGVFSFIFLMTHYNIIGPGEELTPETFPHLLIDILMFAICFWVINLFKYMDSKNILNDKIKNTLTILGKRSLEIYLVQMVILFFIHYKPIINIKPLYPPNGNEYNLMINSIIIITVIFLSIFLGILYGKLVDKFILRKEKS